MLLFLKSIIFLGVINVWLLRRGKSTKWRGGNAPTLKDEFKVYALPDWVFYFVGFAKILSASLIFSSIWIDQIPYKLFALILCFLMIFAILMHMKVRDGIMKSIPALSMFMILMLILNI
tara:strand:+ start:662 stop:1018 length:357 start_codon:yes stop_codon:yes gene_type:complete